MRAIVFDPVMADDPLRYAEVAEPQGQADEVLIRVRACGVNRLDLLAADGPWGAIICADHILGLEPVGDVVDVGAVVENLRVGDRVWVNPLISCGHCEHCLAGDDNLCTALQIVGLHRPGGYAEYVAVPARNVAEIPPSLSYRDAAAIPVAFGTAWHMLITRAHLQPDETVLVIAAGSGVGSAAVQIALARGARVIAAAGADHKLMRAREEGVHATVNYEREPLSRAVQAFTNGRGVDLVVEHVGPATWKHSIASLARNGRLVICGALTGRTVSLDLWTLFLKQHTLIGAYGGTTDDLEAVLTLVQEGQLRPIVDCVFPLHAAADAHRYLAERRNYGKVVLELP